MYCINCGKRVLDTDKFCPYCGSAIKKKIEIDSTLTPEAALKRGYMYLEDSDFQNAENYFDSLLDVMTDSTEVNFGKLLTTKQLKNAEELIEYYKDLYNYDDDLIKEVKLPNDYDNHINIISKENEVEGYLSKDAILSAYNNYNNYYNSSTNTRKKQKESIENEFKEDKLVSRIISLSDKKTNKYFKDILKEYDKRINNSEEADKKEEARILEGYPAFIDQTDEKVQSMYEQAISDRENDYQDYITKIESASTYNDFSTLLDGFKRIQNYKDSNSYIEKCEKRIEEINEENKIIEENNKKLRKRILICAAIVLFMAFSYYLYDINVVIPAKKYEEATQLLENNKYDEAITVFEELGNYSDSTSLIEKSKYKKGLELLNNGQYADAIAVFKEIEDYEDSSIQINEAKYRNGKELYDSGDYDDAINLLNEIIDYKDSQEIVYFSMYRKAILLREKQDFDGAILLFKVLGDFEDASDQLEATEKEKADNSIKVPSITGKTLDSAKSTLDKSGLKYTVTESATKDQKVGTVISVSPSEGTMVLKGTTVEITVAIGSDQYSNYNGNGNNKALFQINITATGNNLRIRSNPTINDDNRVDNAKTGNVFNVYETINNDGYEWYRIGEKRWITYDPAWAIRDSICDRNNGSFVTYKATINDENKDHIGVYYNPGNDNQLTWVDSRYNGDTVTVYYTFVNGSTYWYKIGVNEWIRDGGGDRIIPIN